MEAKENRKANLLALFLVVLLCLGAGIPALLSFAPRAETIRSLPSSLSDGEVADILDDIVSSSK